MIDLDAITETQKKAVVCNHDAETEIICVHVPALIGEVEVLYGILQQIVDYSEEIAAAAKEEYSISTIKNIARKALNELRKTSR